MMHRLRGWASGRQLWLPAGLWGLSLVAVYLGWWAGSDGPWAPFSDPYYTRVMSFVPSLAGAAALYGILPQLTWIDRQAVSHPQRWDTVAAGGVITSFAALPPLVRWLFALNPFYARFVPENLLPDPSALDEAAPFHYFWFLMVETAAVLGATCVMIGLLGRLFGPLAGIGCYLALLVSQGYRLAPGLVPRLDQPHSVVSVLVALLAVVLGLVAFRSSRSGASPLIS
ncbi:MAG: hypothetical protein VB036_00195 [Propionicimonas sp.]|nr:hypothetical protein [Propionicimonas sp.]